MQRPQANTAGTRLRHARERNHLTREQLAQRVAKSASTVRAHEIGQNSIRSNAATAYAKALNVDAVWILFGEPAAPHPENDPALFRGNPHAVPIVGRLKRYEYVFPNSYVDDDSYAFFSSSVFLDAELQAFRLEDVGYSWPPGSILIASNAEWLQPKVGDLVITTAWEDGKVEYGLREMVEFQDRIWAKGPDIDGRTEFTAFPQGFAAGTHEMLGIVVGVTWARPIPAPPQSDTNRD